ncbi:hypothetical protein CRM22_004251 [Opisthorchis felineus]|uniref:Conserved oligomeric Golgi complex subunit 6 n=1 Tax=Opisthorchis felineus TaxID=147828 RepID=A0A4S2LX41_OPIFE|nr:hypothetical protein CRM22_004251 [Opisthorchis felineus]
MASTKVDRNPLSGKINSILSTQLDTNQDLLDGLQSISDILPTNTIQHRRTIRGKIEQHQLELYDSFLSEFTLVKQSVDKLDSYVNDMLKTCHDINDKLMTVKCKTNDLIHRASHLQEESSKFDMMGTVVECLSKTFQLSPQKREILYCQMGPVGEQFFDALKDARSVEDNCRRLMQSGEQQIGLSLLDSTHAVLEGAYQRLYQWIQNECRAKTQEIPELSALFRTAFGQLQDRPVLFKYALDEYAVARRAVVIKLFIDALTLGSGVTSPRPGGGHSKPIELRSHDPLRYTSDMLALMHQLTASEKEYLVTLTHECRETATSEILDACLDAITEGLCSPFKMRMEQVLVALQDAVLLYRINNVLRFYQHTLCGFLGTSARLSTTVNEMQELSWRLLFSSLHQYTRQALDQAEFPAQDLCPSDAVRDTLQLLMEILRAQDISLLSDEIRQASFKEIVNTLLTPLVTHCQNSAECIPQTRLTDSQLGDGISESHPMNFPYGAESATYLANCLYLIESTLAQLDCASEQVEKLANLLNTSVDTLVAAQVTVILRNTNLTPLVQVLEQGHNPENDGALCARNDPGLSEPEVRNALTRFDLYLSNPDRFCLPELQYLTVQKLKKVVRRRAADDVHSRYEKIFRALTDPANGYNFSADGLQGNQIQTKLRSPEQVAELILNF